MEKPRVNDLTAVTRGFFCIFLPFEEGGMCKAFGKGRTFFVFPGILFLLGGT